MTLAKWGPWAGKILTGDEEGLRNASGFVPLIYAIDTNGVVTTNALGIAPEDFDLIPTNQDLYCADQDHDEILKLDRHLFTNYVGDLLITQAGEAPTGTPGVPAALYIVSWDPTNSFVVRPLTYYQFGDQTVDFEHVTFAPVSLPASAPH